MKHERQLYRIFLAFALTACLVGAVLAVNTSGQLAVASLCVAVASLFAMQHLNHRSWLGQTLQVQCRLDGLQCLLQEHVDAGHGMHQQLLLLDKAQVQVAGSIQQIDQQSRKLVELHSQAQLNVTDLIRRAKINHKAILKTDEELRQCTKMLSVNMEQHYQALRRRVDQRYDALRVQGEKLPGEVVGLWHAGKSMLPEHADLPLLGGWAVSAPTLTAMVNEVSRNPQRKIIVECGSGVSTIWLALACRRRGHGHVYALDHDRKFADGTRQYIDRNNLQDWATVLDAPLTLHEIHGQEYMWYSLDGLGDVKDIDLLFVDGPPGDTGPMARLPAFPALSSRLSNDAWVVLDDTIRKEERDIAASWCENPEHGIQLLPLIELPKSLVLAATRQSTS